MRAFNYWLKYRLMPWRYHWLPTGLRPGYSDPRTVLLYAAFASLGRYIEERGGVKGMHEYIRHCSDTEGEEPEHATALRQQEILDIWLWWTERLPADKARRDALCCTLFSGDRLSFAEADEHGFCEMTFKPFEGEEINQENEFRALEQKIADDKRAMLHKLVDLREYLWT